MSEPTAGMLWFVSELYAPEHVSTGHFVTGIAEGVAAARKVGVICSQPTYAARGMRAPSSECRNHVRVFRVTPPVLDKNVLASRLALSVSVSWLLFVKTLCKVRRGDHVIVVTNPPFLPYLVALACRWRGAEYSVLVHDVYPDVLTAVGLIRAGGLMERAIAGAVRRLYAHAMRVIVLGRDMATHARARVQDPRKVIVIPNWGDDDIVRPITRAANPHFTVQYLGNIGRTHDIETLIEAARRTCDSGIEWQFVGDGAKLSVVQSAIETEHLRNVSWRGRVEHEQLSETLGAADVSVVAFVSGMAGISVPSRVYNVMCAGRPIIAVADRGSEVAELVAEHGLGWIVEPGDVRALVRAVEAAASDPAAVADAGARARAVAEEFYTRGAVVAQYVSLVDSLCGPEAEVACE